MYKSKNVHMSEWKRMYNFLQFFNSFGQNLYQMYYNDGLDGTSKQICPQCGTIPVYTNLDA